MSQSREVSSDLPPKVSATILVVDDEPSVRFTLRAILEDEGHTVLEAEDGRSALKVLDAHAGVTLVISDLRMPELDGLGLLDQLRARPSAPPLVMITAHGSERTAVEAMRKGAIDYFRKPFEAEEVVQVVQRTLAQGALVSENRRLKARLLLSRTMVFASRVMSEVAEIVERVARKDVTVLVVGETGTGKELIARALVEGSARAKRPFVKLNCASVPRELVEAELFGHAKGAFTGAVRERKGLFREAHQGTLFLDEINSLEPAAQGSLLRVLQEREVRPVGEDRAVPVDVRLVAATTRPLDQEPNFRRDLYYRLNVVTIALPPLRERRDDIEPLVRHFAATYGERFGFDRVEVPSDVMARLVESPWPGNVRELEHTVERMLALSLDGVLRFELARPEPPGVSAPAAGLSLKDRVDAYERGIIAQTLADCRGNRSETARQLDVDRGTLLSKMKKFGLE
ncbi:sigma-54 dependent transcriptional regulator [Myxococcota bacterium]|nr:sigma-54 dependent transcriptional regulator [Myxococcota bacterium]